LRNGGHLEVVRGPRAFAVAVDVLGVPCLSWCPHGGVLGFGRAVWGLLYFDWCGDLPAVRLGPPGPWWS